MRQYRPPIPLLASLLAIGCGSRSGLLSTETGGAAGSPSGGTTSGGSGGSGGSPVGGSGGGGPCNALVQVEPVLSPMDFDSNALDDGMRLTPTSDDGRQLTAVFVRKTANDVLSLRHATLRPWESWPASGELGPIHASGIETISSHRLARSTGESWATAVRTNDGPRLYRNIDAHAGGPGVPPTPLPGIDPMFVAHQLAGSTSHLVGTFDVGVVGQILRASWVDSLGVPTEHPPLGCAGGQAPRSDAVGFADRWLVAYSRQAGTPSCSSAGGGAPTELDVIEAGPAGPVATLASVADGATIIDLQAAPHPEGIYAVWSAFPTGPSAAISVRALRVDGNTGATTGPTPLFPPDPSGTSFMAGAVGRQLVIARRLGFEATEVTVFDESFAPLASATLHTGASSFPTAVYGAPGGEGVVVAWTKNTVGQFRVQLTRFDCLP